MQRWRLGISITIVVFWLVMMSTLLDRYVLTDSPVPADTTYVEPESLIQQSVSYEEWMQLYSQNAPVGVFHTGLAPLRDQSIIGYRGAMDIIISLGRMGQNFSIRGVALLDKKLQLQKLFVKADLLTMKWEITGIVRDQKLLYMMSRGGESSAGMVNLKAQPTIMDSANNLITQRFNLIPGESYRVPVFDPLWNFSSGEVVITVVGTEKLDINGEEYEVYRVATNLGKFQIMTWVTRAGETIKRTVGDQLVMEKISRKQAIERFPELDEDLEMPEVDTQILEEKLKQGKTIQPFNPLSMLSELLGSND